MSFEFFFFQNFISSPYAFNRKNCFVTDLVKCRMSIENFILNFAILISMCLFGSVVLKLRIELTCDILTFIRNASISHFLTRGTVNYDIVFHPAE